MLRLCIVHVDEFFVLKKNVCYDKVNNIKPVLGGEVGSDMNFALEVFWFKGLNYTATKVASAQECVSLIAQNQSDYMPNPVEWPISVDYDKVNPFTILTDFPMAIVQAYVRTDNSTMKNDIFKASIKGFTWQVWLTLAFLLASFAFLLKSRQHFLKKPFLSLRRLDIRRRKWINCRDEETSDAFFHVISAFCQQASKEYNDSFLVSITFWIYMSSFFVMMMYFSNIMTTDMIVVNKPDVFENYDELLEKRDVIPTFVNQTSDFKHFKYAMNTSREYHFWQRLNNKYHEKDIIADVSDKTSFIPLIRDTSDRRRVLIFNGIMERTVRTLMCKFKQNFRSDILAYAPVDPLSKRFGIGFVVRQASDHAIITRITTKMLHFFDMGITDYNMTESAKGKVSKDLFPEDPPDMHECMSDTVVMLKPGFQAASDSNFKSIAHFCLILVLISAVCLVCEIFTRKLLFAK